VVYWFDSICFILVEANCSIGTIGTNRDKHQSQCLAKIVVGSMMVLVCKQTIEDCFATYHAVM
jgi:hypothetical protein